MTNECSILLFKGFIPAFSYKVIRSYFDRKYILQICTGSLLTAAMLPDNHNRATGSCCI